MKKELSDNSSFFCGFFVLGDENLCRKARGINLFVVRLHALKGRGILGLIKDVQLPKKNEAVDIVLQYDILKVNYERTHIMHGKTIQLR